MNCLVLIFSRNRAFQLDATLRSFLLHCHDAEATKVRVLYTTTDALHTSQYDELNHEYNKHPFIRFVREQDFRSDVLAMLARFDHVVFLVDDTIFVRGFSIQKSFDSLFRHPDALAYSFRLGGNTTYSYMSKAEQRLPSFTPANSGISKYWWPDAQHDFGYPLELSSSLYRVRDIYKVIAQLPFSNPNTLEGQLAEKKENFIKTQPYLLCYEQSVAFSNPLNLVQTAWENRAGQNPLYSSQNLAEKYAQGYRVNVESYANFIPQAVHQEVELNMELQGTKKIGNEAMLREMPPTVSVVIPCYQQAEFLPEAVNSVVLQTYGDWEIIIVNDGSSDHTSDVALSLSRNFPDKKIQLISQANKGLAETRNVGIRNSVGRYILPLDADDIIAPTMLERMVQILETRPDIGIAYPDTATFGEVCEVRQARDWSFPILCTTNILSYCALYRKEVWETVGGYNSNMNPTYEDWDFWIGCGEKGVKGLRIPEPLFIYRVRNNTLASVGMKYDKELKARIILNHPTLYTETLKNSAREILGHNIQGSSSLNGSEGNAMQSDAKDNDNTSSGMPRDHSSNSLKNPLVSVIIPTKNRADMLIDAVRSVLRQTYRHFEIIVINDGGRDVEGVLSNLDPEGRIVYVRLPKSRERSFGRNLGIHLAQGKYIAYLDDDDQYYPQHLETLVDFLESTGHKVAYADAYRVHQVKENGRYVTKSKDLPYSRDFNGDEILVNNFIPNLCLMHAKTCVDHVGGFESSFVPHEDWEFLIRLSQHFSIHHLKAVTAEFSWRMDGSTSTSARQPDFVRTRELIYEKYEAESRAKPNVWKVQQKILGKEDHLSQATFDCSIVIPVFNKVELTRDCLVHLAEVTNGNSYEVIIVDNASTDGTQEFLSSLGGDIRIIRNDENLGFAKGCNQGAASAQGKYVVFLNNDTIPRSGWLSALVKEVDDHQDVDVVGSKLLYLDDTIQHAGVVISRLYHTPYHIFSRVPESLPAVNIRREFQAVTAACMLVRKEAFEKIGGFDESFVNGFEDIDLCLRIRQIGRRVVYQPKSCLYHLESQTPGRKNQDEENAQRFLDRWKHQWLIDEDVVAEQSGFFIQQYVSEEKLQSQLVPFDSVVDPAAWQRVVDLQQELLGRECRPLSEMSDNKKISNILVDVEQWPTDIGILEWVGRVCETLQCEPEALRFWEKLLTLGDHPNARLGLARVHIKCGNFDVAQKHLDALKRGFTPRTEGWMLQGILSMQCQKYFEAKQAFEQALAIEGNHKKARMGWGMACMGLGETAEAWRIFDQMISVDPDDLETMRCLIQAGTAFQRWEALAEHLTRFVERNPADCDMRFALAGVEFRTGHSEKAMEQLTWLRLIKPEYDGLEDLEGLLHAAQTPGNLVSTR